jgi:hypothetical protein
MSDENIILDYPVIIKYGDDAFYANKAEFFMDEHNVQWVKFVPRNGYHKGKEHMLRTHLITVIRNDDKQETVIKTP